MSDNIKQEPPSSSMAANESRKVVPEKAYNKLKRKLEEAKAELENEKKKMKLLVATSDIKFRPKRARISMKLHDFKNLCSHRFTNFSAPLEVAGFQWKLIAIWNGPWLMSVYLKANAPDFYKDQPFKFEVDCSFRLLNTFTSKDIHKEENDCEIVRVESAKILTFAEIEVLSDPEQHFIQPDGSILLEVDFTVKAATFDGGIVGSNDSE